MKIQQILTLNHSEINLNIDRIKDIFDVHEYQYEGRYADLVGFRTTDKSKISTIIYNSEYHSEININNVDILEIEDICI